jgi:hypothetical protein
MEDFVLQNVVALIALIKIMELKIIITKEK